MPRLTDPAIIRSVLETDRPWAVYALGDLDPTRFEHCEWHSAPGPGVVLVYRAFEVPVLFTLGEPDAVRAALAKVRDLSRAYLSIRPAHYPVVAERCAISDLKLMRRMLLTTPSPLPDPSSVGRLGAEDLEELERLYADGRETGGAPDFFAASMLAEGAYFGIRDVDGLAAAAGTHLVSEAENAAAIGNVYVRRNRRGHGLGRVVTSAVARELVERGIRTIALNVAQANVPAIRVYQRLGFTDYCPFYEGVARC